MNLFKEEQKLVNKSPHQTPAVVVKPPLWKRVVDEVVHYYHGFRLLSIEVRISFNLLFKVLQGDYLTRRERKQLVRTTADLFRLVPFVIIIITPFLELALPIFIKLFPNMLPSTFQTTNEKEAKLRTNLKVKLEMAKFLQQTLDEMSVKGKGHKSNTAKDFADFFVQIRSSGAQPTQDEILKFSKLFEDEITLDSLSRPQLVALCRVLEISPIGTNMLLRFLLRMRLRSLAADDKLIQKEGIDSLSISELQAACRTRGMRALGISEIRLKSQLLQWLDLSLNQKVPPSLMLLSRALYLPDSDLTSDQLLVTIASLPDSVATKTIDAISQRRGKIDNAARIRAIEFEQEKIKEERLETSSARDVLVDTAPVLQDKAEPLSQADVATIENALENIGVQRKRLLIEKEELMELKEEMAEYQEDVEELKEFIMLQGKQADTKREKSSISFVRESRASRRLFRTVNRMIQRLDKTVGKFEAPRLTGTDNKVIPAAEEIVSIEDMISSIRRLQANEDSSKLQQIIQMLVQIDQDRDGVVKVDDIMRVIDLLSEEKFQMTPNQMSEVLNLVNKEELLEMDEKLEKALGQTKSNKPSPSPSPSPSSAAPSNPIVRPEGDQEVNVEKFPITDVEKAFGLCNVSAEANSKTVPEQKINAAPLNAEEVERLVSQSEEIVHNLENKTKVSNSQSSAK